MKRHSRPQDEQDEKPSTPEWLLVRRDFLKRSGLAYAGFLTASCASGSSARDRKTLVSIGMVTDAHFADADMRRNRFYRESTDKMEECVRFMNDRSVDFLIELGDFKDMGDPASPPHTLKDLEAIEAVFANFNGPRYHVLGNHDMDCISKKQFIERIENTGIASDLSCYSFDTGGIHFIVLDANYASDGNDYCRGEFSWNDANIPGDQRRWLNEDLKSTESPVIIFVHQQLDDNGGFTIRNAAQVRRILEQSGKVLAVFQGHYHEGAHTCIEGIHYYTLKAMVDGSGAANSSYAIAEVKADGSIIVSGYRKAVSVTLKHA